MNDLRNHLTEYLGGPDAAAYAAAGMPDVRIGTEGLGDGDPDAVANYADGDYGGNIGVGYEEPGDGDQPAHDAGGGTPPDDTGNTPPPGGSDKLPEPGNEGGDGDDGEVSGYTWRETADEYPPKDPPGAAAQRILYSFESDPVATALPEVMEFLTAGGASDQTTADSEVDQSPEGGAVTSPAENTKLDSAPPDDGADGDTPPPQRLVIGETGSGKTALVRQIAEQIASASTAAAAEPANTPHIVFIDGKKGDPGPDDLAAKMGSGDLPTEPIRFTSIDPTGYTTGEGVIDGEPFPGPTAADLLASLTDRLPSDTDTQDAIARYTQAALERAGTISSDDGTPPQPPSGDALREALDKALAALPAVPDGVPVSPFGDAGLEALGPDQVMVVSGSGVRQELHDEPDSSAYETGNTDLTAEDDDTHEDGGSGGN